MPTRVAVAAAVVGIPPGVGGGIPASGPTANFTRVIIGTQVNFTDTSTDVGGTIASWAWTFGDASTSTLQNPTHTYATGGTYSVGLTVTDNLSRTSLRTIPNTVTVPTANFTSAPTNLVVAFTDTSTDVGGTIVSWAWNFGDSGTSTLQNPTHTYLSANTYSVSLTVTDSGGNTNNHTVGVTVSSGSAAPTKVQILIQGQVKQEDTSGAEGLPTAPNRLTIGWKSVAGATSYNIYRSVDQGAYTLYASTQSAASVASAYATYVTNSSGYPLQADVDCSYVDTAATNCVGSVGTGIVNGSFRDGTHPPDSNGVWLMPNVGYTYKVSAIVSGAEGSLSTDSVLIFFANGKAIHNKNTFNGTLVWNDTNCPVASPLGYTTNAMWTTGPGDSLINPFAGNSAVDGNLSVKGFNYIYLWVYSNQVGSTFLIEPELVSDMPLLVTYPNSTTYGGVTNGQWKLLKIPLSDMLKDVVGGTNAIQFSYYKITFDTQSAAVQKFWLEWWFAVN